MVPCILLNVVSGTLSIGKRIKINYFTPYSPTDGVSPFFVLTWVRICAEYPPCHVINKLCEFESFDW